MPDTFQNTELRILRQYLSALPRKRQLEIYYEAKEAFLSERAEDLAEQASNARVLLNTHRASKP